MKKFLFVLCLLLSACCFRHNALLNGRIGMTENELIEKNR